MNRASRIHEKGRTEIDFAQMAFAIASAGDARNASAGDLFPLDDGPQEGAPSRTLCLAPVLAEQQCYEMRGSSPYRPANRIRSSLCYPLPGVVKVGAFLPTADPSARCPSGRPDLAYSQPRPLTSCLLRPARTPSRAPASPPALPHVAPTRAVEAHATDTILDLTDSAEVRRRRCHLARHAV